MANKVRENNMNFDMSTETKKFRTQSIFKNYINTFIIFAYLA